MIRNKGIKKATELAISINSNIAALNAERRLSQNTASLRQAFERVSSGSRINHASDDAAGLAVAEALNTDSRVYAQGIRNANDGLSMLAIAESALDQIGTITVRLSELGEQSANGTLSNQQRKAIHAEGVALVDEFNRIVETISFGERRLFDVGSTSTILQLGYGQNESLAVSLGSALVHQAGDGTFQAVFSVSVPEATAVESFKSIDINGDGNIDLISGGFTGSSAYIQLGNGNGTFKAAASYINVGKSIELADLNNDGILDLIGYGSGTTIRTLLGNGNGTFRASTSLSIGGGSYLSLSDHNGDGKLDIFTADATSVTLAYGNGNGSFTAGTVVATGTNISALSSGDVNGDSLADILVSDYGASQLELFTGTATGSFQLTTQISATHIRPNALVDINDDGALDIVGVGSNITDQLIVVLGNGNGTFHAAMRTSTQMQASGGLDFGDLNGDGHLDIVHATNSGDQTLRVFLGNGDGTLLAQISVGSGPGAVPGVGIADVNNDGALDLLNQNRLQNTISISYGNPRDLLTIVHLNFRTRQSAREALADIEDIRSRVIAERSRIGAQQNRLSVGINNLDISVENRKSAGSQITDVDLAEESVKLLRMNILQQVGSAILTQANQGPALALQLLRS